MDESGLDIEYVGIEEPVGLVIVGVVDSVESDLDRKDIRLRVLRDFALHGIGPSLVGFHEDPVLGVSEPHEEILALGIRAVKVSSSYSYCLIIWAFDWAVWRRH